MIRELTKLNRDELAQIDLKLHELLEEKIGAGGRSWGEALLEVAGSGGSSTGLGGESRSLSSWAAASMKVFGDTVHFIALLSTGDRWHARAVAINRQPPGPLEKSMDQG